MSEIKTKNDARSIALKLLLVGSHAWRTMDAFWCNHRGSDTRAARHGQGIASSIDRPQPAPARRREANPEVAAHAERVLALVRGLADARRARCRTLRGAASAKRLASSFVPTAHRATLRRPQPHAGAAPPRPQHQGRQAHLPRVPRRRGPAEQAHRRVCFEHADAVRCVAAAPDGRVITGSRRHDRQGVARRRVRAHHPGAHSARRPTRWRCCRAERASSAARTTAPRSCGRSTALSSAPSRWAI